MCNFKMTFPLKKVSQEKKVSLLSALPAAQSSVQRIYIVGFALHHHDSLTLFRKKKFALTFLLKKNASKFSTLIYLKKKNREVIFLFHFEQL